MVLCRRPVELKVRLTRQLHHLAGRGYSVAHVDHKTLRVLDDGPSPHPRVTRAVSVPGVMNHRASALVGEHFKGTANLAVIGALDHTRRARRRRANGLNPLPGRCRISRIVEVVDQILSFRHDHFEVTRIARVALDQAARSGRILGDVRGEVPGTGRITAVMPVMGEAALVLENHHLQVPFVTLSQVALNQAPGSDGLLGDHAAEVPLRIRIGAVVPVMHQAIAFRHHHLQMAVFFITQITLNDRSGARRSTGDRRGGAIPIRARIRVVMPVVAKESAFKDHDFKVSGLSESALDDGAGAVGLRGDGSGAVPDLVGGIVAQKCTRSFPSSMTASKFLSSPSPRVPWIRL